MDFVCRKNEANVYLLSAQIIIVALQGMSSVIMINNKNIYFTVCIHNLIKKLTLCEIPSVLQQLSKLFLWAGQLSQQHYSKIIPYFKADMFQSLLHSPSIDK